MFAFYTSSSKQTKESDTQWGRDHRNLIEAFVYSEFDMFIVAVFRRIFLWNTLNKFPRFLPFNLR